LRRKLPLKKQAQAKSNELADRDLAGHNGAGATASHVMWGAHEQANRIWRDAIDRPGVAQQRFICVWCRRGRYNPRSQERDGLSLGISTNQPDEQSAKDTAVKNCRKYGGPASQKLCQPVMTFKNKCVSTAADPKPGTPGIGWAVGATGEDAMAEALSRCRSTAGTDRQSFCANAAWKSQCDGTAK
jgi:hypothetical protein